MIFIGGQEVIQDNKPVKIIDCQEYFNNLYSKSKGYITRAEISDGKYHQWHFKLPELIKQDFDKPDIYISMSTFYKPFRRMECLKELRAVYIDLDVYNTDYRKDAALFFLENDYFRNEVPTPHYIIDSGRGLYLIWLIEPVPYMALPLWQAIERNFFNKLDSFGADPKCLDCTRILRVPQSINSKSNTEVSIIVDYQLKELYSLRWIQENYLPELVPPKKKVGRPCKIVSLFNTYSLYSLRIKDIIKICELRNYDIVGYRELILFLYRYYLCYFTNDTDKALEDTLNLNKLFKKPLTEREARNQTYSAEKVYLDKDKQYNYKNETLIDLLDITPEEQKHLETIISKSEKNRRKRDKYNGDDEYKEVVKTKRKIRYEEQEKEVLKQKYRLNKDKYRQKYKEKLESKGKKLKSEELELLRQKIKALKQQGFSNKDISQSLNLPLKTLERHIRYIKTYSS